MYHVITNSGEYAVKILNSDIMKRPEALNNMINSEKVSHALSDKIPLIAAKSLDGKYVAELEKSFFMVFDWMNAESVFASDITTLHCKEIGKILGMIHRANIVIEDIKKERAARKPYEWDIWLAKAAALDTKWLPDFYRIAPKLKKWDRTAAKSVMKASEAQVISHRDMDPKNVIWQENSPYVIDWEAAGYINPFQELIEILNYWTAEQDGNYNEEKLRAVMDEYTENIYVGNVCWEAVTNCGFDGMLGWLDYKLKCALKPKDCSQDDLKDEVDQVLITFDELRRYEMRIVWLRNWLNKYILAKYSKQT